MAFPQDPNDVDIELYYDGVWNNINSYVFHRDAAPISISRGRANEGKRCDPGTLDCSLNNRDGRFSPRNPSSPLYGKIGRFTPIRVSVTYSAVTYVRFVGEVVSWPSRWDVSGKDIWVPLKAAGILRRLGQAKKPIRSALFRATAGVAENDYVPWAYWSLEDGENATQAAFSLPGGTPATVTGDVTFAADAEMVGSDALPFLSAGSVITGQFPTYTDTGQWFFQISLKIDTAPSSDTTYLEIDTPGGANAKWRLYIQPGSPDIVWFVGITAAGAPTGAGIGVLLDGSASSNPSEADFYGSWWFFNLYVYSSTFVYGGLALSNNGDNSGSAAGSALDTVAASAATWRLYGGNGIAAGHAALFVDTNFSLADALLNATAIDGNPGVTDVARITDLCRQAQITVETVGDSQALMGAERIVTLLQALRDAEDVGQGFLHETRDVLGLRYRSNRSYINQLPTQISYTTKGLGHPLDPEPDDLNVANDREVKRRNGSSARRELTSGPLSTQDPPDGIGRLDDSITIDAYTDDQLEHIANWRLHVGTWDAERYPRVRMDLSANASLIPDIAPLDSGDLIAISDLPTWLPPGDAELLIEGYREVIGFYDWDITFNCSPAGPYNVVGVWGLMSHELRANINSSTTSIDVVNTDLTQPMLPTSGLGSGFGVTIGGEEMQVTAVADSTITFGNTGTASTGSSGSRTPGLPTGSASGNLVLIFASTRNSGTGTVDTPSNWTRLPIFPSSCNAQVFARVYDGVWSMPTVTYTGGAANEDTIAQSMRLAGKWSDPSKIVVGAAQCLNASAQNITYPGLPKPLCDNAIVIYFGWKQDDYTSVATISSAAEIQESSSTAGNDASQIWDYVIQTTATAIPSGAFTVTGGASAINRGAVAALRCDYQVATVTRSTNGVSASHTAGDDITLTRPMRWGLL